MSIGKNQLSSIWVNENNCKVIQVIDQRKLPHHLVIMSLKTLDDVLFAINEMVVRGAPLIGVTAAFGMYLAAVKAGKQDGNENWLEEAAKKLQNTRPTAVDLFKAVERQKTSISQVNTKEGKITASFETACAIRQESIEVCENIGLNGLKIIEEISKRNSGGTVNILTHCNAGWLAAVKYGTALAPVYLANDCGIKVHVWVDETRPRNQGATLTAWELLNHGVPNTVIADNTGGHLMQHGMVDMVIVGTDRTTRQGDVANKIGTYLKALAAKDNGIPFYVAAPSSSIDFTLKDGLKEIVIEQRSQDEVKYISGMNYGRLRKVLLTSEKSKAANYGFDVTPARLVSALITERGICPANEKEILGLFPEYDT